MQKSTDHALSWIGLSSIQGVGRITFRKLASHFGSPEQALSASADDLRNAGLSDGIVHEIVSGKWREHAEQELAKAERAKVAIITADDPAYPDSLKNTSDHPLYLYVKGSMLQGDGNAVANEPKHIDSIMQECRATAGMLNGVLISLELKGLVKQLPGKYYVLDEKS